MQKIDYLQEKINNILNELNSVISDLNNIKSKNIEHFEVLYDKDSDDVNINKNNTTGFVPGSFSGLDIDKYKALICYTAIENDCQKIYVDLTRLNGNSYYFGSCTSSRVQNSSRVEYTTRIAIPKNKSEITMSMYKATSSMKGNSLFYCYRIEGVL